jgi:hypothetical protein
MPKLRIDIRRQIGHQRIQPPGGRFQTLQMACGIPVPPGMVRHDGKALLERGKKGLVDRKGIFHAELPTPWRHTEAREATGFSKMKKNAARPRTAGFALVGLIVMGCHAE